MQYVAPDWPEDEDNAGFYVAECLDWQATSEDDA